MKKMKKMKKFICCMLSVCMVAGILSLNLPVKEVKAEDVVAPVEYTVAAQSQDDLRFLLCNKTPVAQGKKVTLTYTVSEFNGAFGNNGLCGTNKANLEHSTGIGYTTLRALVSNYNRVAVQGKTYQFTMGYDAVSQTWKWNGGILNADGTLQEAYKQDTHLPGFGNNSDATEYFGIVIYGNATVKLTNVTCVDENGNDLGLQMNTGAVGTIKVVEKPVVEYTVDMKDTATGDSRFLLCSGKATTGPITLSYTVESSNHQKNATPADNTAGNNGLIAVTDTRLTNGSYNYVRFNNGYNRMMIEGYSYTLTMSWDSANKKIVWSGGYKEPDGTYTELDSVYLNQEGSLELASESPDYLGIVVFKSTTARLTHVTCVDAAGNDLGVRTNQTQKCKIQKMPVEYTVNVESTGSDRFLLCNKIPVAKGKKVTLTYTVASTNLETEIGQYNGFVGTSESKLNDTGVGYSDTTRLARTDNRVLRNGKKHTFTLWLNENGQIDFTGGAYREDGSLEDYASNVGGYFNAGPSNKGTSATQYLGIYVYADTTVKLADVTCVDENGNDLGVRINAGADGTIVQNEITTDTMKLCAYTQDKFAEYRTNHTAPAAIRGYAFAGWYTDAEGVMPVKEADSVTNKYVYAKYVPEDVLSVKLQLTKGTTTGSKKTDMRLITSVDSTRYQLVGFAVTAKVTVDGDEKNQTKKYEQSTCYSTLNGAGLTYYPREFHDASESFITSLLKDMPISGTDLSKEITITPYWKTMDGTTYYGVSRTITKQQALDAAAAAS